MSGTNYLLSAFRPCTLALRREGLAVRTARCLRCGGGPCLDPARRDTPNRLYGVTVNEDGEAV